MWNRERGRFREFTQHFEWRITGRWMIYSALIGVAGALGALLFAWMLHHLTSLALVRGVGYTNPLAGGEAGGNAQSFDWRQNMHLGRVWLLPVVSTLGGLLTGILVQRFAPEAEGHGTDAVIRSFHQQGGRIRPQVPIIKTIASALTIGSGGSAGREGPIAQIGAGFGSFLATRLGLSDRDRRTFVVAGMAAGIASIFQAPLGGAFFAVEVLYREDIEAALIMPAVIAAITGYSVYSTLVGSSSIFVTPTYSFVNPLELLPLVLLAVVCAVVGIIYVRFFYGLKHQVFDRLPLPFFLKPALGGLALGLLAIVIPPVLGSSYGWLQQAINGNLPVGLMLLLVGAKILATSLTISSGGSGGVFAPSLVIGGMLGGSYGWGLHAVFPRLVEQPTAYVLIGMATFFAGAANVPISTTIMISELTGSYTLLVPLIFAGTIAHLIGRRWSLYTQQVRTHNESPAHRSEVDPALLSGLHASDLLKTPSPFPALAPASTLDQILEAFGRTSARVLPVSSGAGTAPSGLVYLDHLQTLLRSDDTLHRLIVAQDVEVPFASLSASDSLDQVLAAFESTGYPELPVVDEGGRILGLVREEDLAAEYHRALLRWRKQQLVL